MPSVSVLMPVYNCQGYLHDSIENVLGQTFTDFEFIIVDDGSTDDSVSVIEEYARRDKRIRLIRNPENVGIIRALVTGIQHCTGEYIARMDADDISLPDRLERQYVFMQAHPEIDVLGSNAILIDEQGRPLNRNLLSPSDPMLIWMRLFFQNPIIHSSVFARSAFYKRFNENSLESHYLHAEDYAFWLRMGFDHQYANLDAFLVKYRIHEMSVSRQYTEIQRSNHLLAAQNAYRRLLGRDVALDVLKSFIFFRHYRIDDPRVNREAVRTLALLAKTFAKRYALSSSQKTMVKDFVFEKIAVYISTYRQNRRVVIEGLMALLQLNPKKFFYLASSSLGKRLFARKPPPGHDH